jgi:hypothetical protein
MFRPVVALLAWTAMATSVATAQVLYPPTWRAAGIPSPRIPPVLIAPVIIPPVAISGTTFPSIAVPPLTTPAVFIPSFSSRSMHVPQVFVPRVLIPSIAGVSDLTGRLGFGSGIAFYDFYSSAVFYPMPYAFPAHIVLPAETQPQLPAVSQQASKPPSSPLIIMRHCGKYLKVTSPTAVRLKEVTESPCNTVREP